ncbi:hypothetical protein FOZ62_021131, partial [Perkinsus olseni]
DEQLIDTRLVDTAYGLGWMNSQAAEVESYQRRREDEDADGEDENMSQAENRPAGGQSGDEGSANHVRRLRPFEGLLEDAPAVTS